MLARQRLFDSRLYVGVVVASFAFALLHAGPLFGTKPALLLTVITHVYLPGLLLARVFGKHAHGHPITRFIWILVSGLSVTICLGGVARFFAIPIPVFVVLLHSTMLVFALMRPRAASDTVRRQLSRANLPLYGLLLICCIVVLGIGIVRSRFRLNSYPDQTVFIEQINWLASGSPPIDSRRVGVAFPDPRLSTDGWTYTHAVWVWESGISAPDLIWYDLTPLFVWTIPLALFALAYEVTRREEAAAWSAAALSLLGLITLDGLIYVPTSLAFGFSSLFQLSTLRLFSTALMLPLTLFTALSYLKCPKLRDLLLVFLATLALAILHPRQVTIFLVSIGATGILWWLAQPTRARFTQVSLLGIMLTTTLALPILQRGTLGDRFDAQGERLEESILASTSGESPVRWSSSFTVVENVPLIGDSYIVRPEIIFYHPGVVLAVVLGLLTVIYWRRSLAAQYVLGATSIVLILLFVPGITPFYVRVTHAAVALSTVYALPIALVYGLTLDELFKFVVGKRSREYYGQWIMASVLAATMLILIVEPVPIPASANDMIRAANQAQALRALHPADEQLPAMLAQHLPANQQSILIAPNYVGNVIVESVPNTLITGGRDGNGNMSFANTARFFSESSPVAPWLDSTDVRFIAEYGVTYILMRADDTRLPQLLLQSTRFEYLDSTTGYYLFRVRIPIEVTPTDDLFQRMNDVYGQLSAPRWDSGRFELQREVDPTVWIDIVSEWQRMLTQDPDNLLNRYGLAFSYLLMGNDDLSLPLWESLYDERPDISLFTDSFSYTLKTNGDVEASVQPLLRALEHPEVTIRVLAARTLLTDDFFYLLDEQKIDQILAVTQADFAIWDLLANSSQPGEIRKRVGLLLSAELWDHAAAWLHAIPDAELNPQDFVTLAYLALANGDVEGALSLLRPTTDTDWIAAKSFLHPDRWENNVAAQLYALLIGDLAYRERRWSEAEAAYQQAYDWGALWAGRYFLSQSWAASGQQDRADAMFAQLESEWRELYDQRFPILDSPLTVADTGSLYAMQLEVSQEDSNRQLAIWATYGNPNLHGEAYPVQSWRVEIVSQDGITHYVTTEQPAIFVDVSLVRAAIQITLPEDLDNLTAARLFLEPRYSNTVTYRAVTRDVVLNRPDSAEMGPNTIPLHLQFGSAITLQGYETSMNNDSIEVTLFWEANAALDKDYQVFLHLIDYNGDLVFQRDGGPVDGAYPTSQWRVNTTIADRHVIPLSDQLEANSYQMRVGLYSLPDVTRLPITPLGEQVENDSVLLTIFVNP